MLCVLATLFMMLSLSNVKGVTDLVCSQYSRGSHIYFIRGKNIDCGADMYAPFLFSQQNYWSSVFCI